MKQIIERVIQRKNPQFKFDQSVNNRILLNLLLRNCWYLVRGFCFCFSRMRPLSMIFIGKGVSFFNSQNIVLERWCRIERGAFLSGLGRGKLIVGRSSSIGAFSQIIISASFNNLGSYILIGNHVGIGQFASIGGSGGVSIGDNCIIGQYFSCHPENHNYTDSSKLIKDQGTSRAPIVIGENCWIGAKVTILAGVTIGSGCVIAAGAVVTKNMPPDSVVGGIPAKVIKNRFTN